MTQFLQFPAPRLGVRVLDWEERSFSFYPLSPNVMLLGAVFTVLPEICSGCQLWDISQGVFVAGL